MTAFLPPNLLALFAPRDPIPYLPPNEKLPHEKKRVPYTGLNTFLQDFEDPKDTPPPTRCETREERQERRRRERTEQVAYKLEQDLALWDPATNPHSTEDPFKSLFISRINFDTSESKLRREFETYGSIKKISMIADINTAKPRGYAFVEYEHERDMHSAYKHADGKKIDGRRVLVDVERSRTVKGWRPRRLGGGLGGTRKGGADVNTRFSGRDDNADRRSATPDRRDRRRRSRSHGERERRDRGDRGDRDREKRHRSKSRERRRKSRSKERRRSRDRDREIKDEPTQGEGQEVEVREKKGRRSKSRDRKRSRRSRSKDHDREKKRSRSRERKRKRSRSRERRRGSRDRDRGDRGERGDRDRGDRAERNERVISENGDMPIEPEVIDYGHTSVKADIQSGGEMDKYQEAQKFEQDKDEYGNDEGYDQE